VSLSIHGSIRGVRVVGVGRACFKVDVGGDNPKVGAIAGPRGVVSGSSC